jgi:hypothetical protein
MRAFRFVAKQNDRLTADKREFEDLLKSQQVGTSFIRKTLSEIKLRQVTIHLCPIIMDFTCIIYVI